MILRADARRLPLAAGCIDAIVTDPPYEISFMSKTWDSSGVAYDPATWAQSLRVLKPGGFMLAFGGTRTWHRQACAIEDAGFEIRDSIAWMHGQGFPKAPNALKPAFEPIVVARKPLAGTVASNVQAYGTGALNIDGCRVEWDVASLAADTARRQYARTDITGGNLMAGIAGGHVGAAASPPGRWPSNVVLTHAGDDTVGDLCADGCVAGCPAAELDAQSGRSASPSTPVRQGGYHGGGYDVGRTTGQPRDGYGIGYGDSGGASRYFPTFRYQAKAPTSERPKVNGTSHPTVKPLALMQWLVRLVTPPGGMVLDPFAGSGTTWEACVIEGFRCITIDLDGDHLPLIAGRLSKPIQPALDLFGGEP